MPDAVAVCCADRTLTYGELNARANRLARHLREQGVGHESLVALCLPRSEWLVVCALAVLKAGGAYVPLDPTAPPERLGHVLTDSAPRVVLVDGALPDGLEAGTAVVVDVPGDADRWAQLPDSDPEPVPGSLPGRPGVCDLHLGVDGTAQGRDGRAPQRRPVLPRGPGVVRLPGRGRVDAVPLHRVRLHGLGDVGRAAAPRAARGGHPGRGAQPGGLLHAAVRGGRDRARPDPHRVRPADRGAGGTAHRTRCGRCCWAARSWTPRRWRRGSGGPSTTGRRWSTCGAPPRRRWSPPTGRWSSRTPG